MPLYLSPYTGTGTKQNPYRPTGLDTPDASAVDIRLDCTRVDGNGVGFALLWVPMGFPDPVGSIKIADDYDDRLTTQQRTRLNQRTGLNFVADTTIQDAVETIMVRQDLVGMGTWQRIRPTNGMYECWLGSGSGKRRWVDLPVIAGGTITDNFTRANETPLSSPWTNTNGSTCNLSSNTLAKTSGFDETLYYYSRVNGWNADQTSQFLYATAVSDRDWGPAVRVATSGATAYFFALWSGGPAIFKVVSGTFSVVQNLTIGGSTGVPYKISAVGSTLRAYENGSEVTGSPGTDTSITSAGGGAGVYYYNPNGALDDFEATGEITTGGTGNLLLLGVGAIRLAAAVQLPYPMGRRKLFKLLSALVCPEKRI